MPRRRVRQAPVAEPAKESQSVDVLSAIALALCKGQRRKVLELVNTALAEGKTAEDILNNGLIAGMNTLGDDFSAGRAFVPEMLIAAKCMSQAMEVLKPLLQGAGIQAVGKAVIGTVKGDLHDIGKNIVKLAFESSGIDVVDLGVDSSAEVFVETAKKENCSIIACSSLLTTSMGEMARVVRLAEEAGIRDRVLIMIGGAPTSQEYCDAIGADLYTPDAATAARKAVEALRARSA
ncbi:MAG: corrinoid protein [Oscillospiraceae bacterium]|nr:corrinoid protein [Oscillospiraceae bacterium]